MKRNWVAVLVAALLALAVFAACGNNTTDPAEQPAVLTVDTADIEAVSGKEFSLPAASATDRDGSDISVDTRVNVYFPTDKKFVYPSASPMQGAPAKEETKLTLVKCGEYEVVYFVRDSAGEKLERQVKLTVTADTETERKQNLAADPSKWAFGGNSFVNADGYIEIGQPGKAGEEVSTGPSASYAGKKIAGGDIVTFVFNSNSKLSGDGKVYFWNINFLLTHSYDQDQPGEDEGVWPNYFNIRLSSTRMEMMFVDIGGKDVRGFEENADLLDGKDHKMSVQAIVTAESLSCRVWVDADTTAQPTHTGTITKAVLEQKFPAGSYDENLFTDSAEGWFTVGGHRETTEGSADSFVIKGLTINNEAYLDLPELSAEAPEELYYLNEEIVFAAATARDANDYSDLTGAVKVFVQEPGGARTEITDTLAFTPEKTSEHGLIYRVTDRSGNTSYLKYGFNVLQQQSDLPPVLEFAAGTEDEQNAVLGEAFQLPVVMAASDEFGNDLSDHLAVSVSGKENAALTGLSEYVFYTPGSYRVTYELTGLNGLKTAKEFTVTVTSPEGLGAGNLIDAQKTDGLHLASGAVYSADRGGLVLGDAEFSYKGRKLYDEKVSMILYPSLATDSASNDGSQLIMINVRGGGNSATEGIGWPKGLMIEWDWHLGIKVYSAGHDSIIYASYFPAGGLRSSYHGKDVCFEYQASDTLDEDGNVIAVTLTIWINSQKIDFLGTYADENKNVTIKGNALAANSNLFSSGWFMFSTYGSDTVNHTTTVVKELYIDGTETGVYEVKVNAAGTAEYEGEYEVPAATVLYRGEDVSRDVKIFLYDKAADQPDITGAGIRPGKITVEYGSGFELWYVHNGKVIYRAEVLVNAEICDQVWSAPTENLSCTVGTEIELPVLTSVSIYGSAVTSGFTYRAEYQPAYSVELSGQTFVPMLRGGFTVNAYYRNVIVGSYRVQTLPAAEGNLVGADGWHTSDNYVYNKELLYNNTITLNLNITKTHVMGISLRGMADASKTGYSWPNNLRLYIDGGWIRVQKGTQSAPMEYSAAAWTDYYKGEGDYELRITVFDVYENGNLAGIKVSVSVNGEQVRFGGSCADSQKNCFIPLEKCDEAFFQPSIFGYFVADSKVVVNSVTYGDAEIAGE